MITHQGRPEARGAVVYNQDELYDFAKNGGSVSVLFEEAVAGGIRFIIMQQPIDGRADVVMMLERSEDISRWEDYRQKMHDWRENVLGTPPIVKNGESGNPVQHPAVKPANDERRKTSRG